MSGLPGHNTGGTIHIIINNQIGFTTSPRFARSSPYPSDIAKMVEAPIIHVNGDDPEAVVYAARIATDFNKFNRDVALIWFVIEGLDTMKETNRLSLSLLCIKKYAHIHHPSRFMEKS